MNEGSKLVNSVAPCLGAFYVRPTHPDQVLFPDLRGQLIWRTTDAGASGYSKITVPFKEPSNIVFNPFDKSPLGLVALFDGVEQKLYISADSGLSWSKVGDGAVSQCSGLTLFAFFFFFFLHLLGSRRRSRTPRASTMC